MALEITVGLPQLAINEGNAVLVNDPDGQIIDPGDKGLYFFRFPRVKVTLHPLPMTGILVAAL